MITYNPVEYIGEDFYNYLTDDSVPLTLRTLCELKIAKHINYYRDIDATSFDKYLEEYATRRDSNFSSRAWSYKITAENIHNIQKIFSHYFVLNYESMAADHLRLPSNYITADRIVWHRPLEYKVFVYLMTFRDSLNRLLDFNGSTYVYVLNKHYVCRMSTGEERFLCFPCATHVRHRNTFLRREWILSNVPIVYVSRLILSNIANWCFNCRFTLICQVKRDLEDCLREYVFDRTRMKTKLGIINTATDNILEW